MTVKARRKISTWEELFIQAKNCIDQEDCNTPPHINFDLICPDESKEIKKRLRKLLDLGLFPIYAKTDHIAVFVWNKEDWSEQAVHNFSVHVQSKYGGKFGILSPESRFSVGKWFPTLDIISTLIGDRALHRLEVDLSREGLNPEKILDTFILGIEDWCENSSYSFPCGPELTDTTYKWKQVIERHGRQTLIRILEGFDQTFFVPFSIKELLHHPETKTLFVLRTDTISFLDARSWGKLTWIDHVTIPGATHLEVIPDRNISLIKVHTSNNEYQLLWVRKDKGWGLVDLRDCLLLKHI